MIDIVWVIPPVLISILVIGLIYCIKTGTNYKELISMIFAVLIVIMIVVPITSVEPSSVEKKEISYDDYILGNNIVSCDGSFEKVTINGNIYAHAISTGPGKISYDNGKTKNFNVEKADLDIFLFLGQSNAANWAGVNKSLEASTPMLGSCYYFGTETHQANKNLNVEIQDYEIYPMTNDGLSPNIGGIDCSFAAAYNILSGNKILVVNGAIGGVNIESYLPGGTSYTYAQDMLTTAYSKIDKDNFNPIIKDYVWIQGESNYSTPINTYKQYFLQMHDTLINGTFFEYGSFDKCIMSKVREYNAVNPSAAQIQLAKEYDTILMATTIADTFTINNGLMLTDDLHYTQYGRNIIGNQLAIAITN